MEASKVEDENKRVMFVSESIMGASNSASAAAG